MSERNISPVIDPLPALYDLGLLTDLDLHFARFASRLAGGESAENAPRPAGEGLGARESLELAAALASHATGQGDICVNLRQWAWRWNASATEPAAFAPPPIGDWLEILRSSPVVGRPGERHPLILDRRGSLVSVSLLGVRATVGGRSAPTGRRSFGRGGRCAVAR